MNRIPVAKKNFKKYGSANKKIINEMKKKTYVYGTLIPLHKHVFP